MKSICIENVKTILCPVGFQWGFWDNQNFINATWFTQSANQKSKDQFMQNMDLRYRHHIRLKQIFKNEFPTTPPPPPPPQNAYISILRNNYVKHLGREITDSQ